MNPASLICSTCLRDSTPFSRLVSLLGFGIYGSLCQDLLCSLVSPRGSCLSFKAQFKYCVSRLPLHAAPLSELPHCVAPASRLGALGWQGQGLSVVGLPRA